MLDSRTPLLAAAVALVLVCVGAPAAVANPPGLTPISTVAGTGAVGAGSGICRRHQANLGHECLLHSDA